VNGRKEKRENGERAESQIINNAGQCPAGIIVVVVH
jgi:hypothetical protein